MYRWHRQDDKISRTNLNPYPANVENRVSS